MANIDKMGQLNEKRRVLDHRVRAPKNIAMVAGIYVGVDGRQFEDLMKLII